MCGSVNYMFSAEDIIYIAYDPIYDVEVPICGSVNYMFSAEELSISRTILSMT